MRPYYQDEFCTLYCADCKEILPRLSSGFDLLLTDPPYGIGFAAQPTRGQRLSGARPQTWDDHAPDMGLLDSIRGVCKDQIIWGGNYFSLPPSRCWLSWKKPDAPPSMGNVEYAWTNLDQNSRAIDCSISQTNAERLGHPTQKPLKVVSFCLSQIKAGYPFVFDPFAGSGTVLRACKDRRLKVVGVEINPAYCAMIERRLRQEVLGL